MLFRVVSLALVSVLLGTGLASGAFSTSNSSSMQVSTVALGSLGQVTAVTADGCSTVEVGWSSATGADSYLVEVRRDQGAWTAIHTAGSEPTAFTDTGSTSASELQYRVTPVHAASGWRGPFATSPLLACG